MKNKLIAANVLRYTARYFLLVLGVLVFIFALVSGAMDNSLKSILLNSPNALPWLVLIILTFIAWKWELIGGIIITALGLFMIWFFNISGSNFFLVTFILTLLISLLGSFFIISWWLRKKQKNILK